MALVEAVLRELFQEVEDRIRLLRRDLVDLGTALDEDLAFLRHFLGILLTHGAAEEIRLAEGVAGKRARGLLHLLLVDDDAVGLRADLLEERVGVLDLLLAPLALHVVVDELHRARTVERDQGDDVGEVLDLEALGGRGHAAGLELEDTDRLAAVQKVEGHLVIHRDL